MKKLLPVFVIVLLTFTTFSAFAKLKVLGKGEQMQIDINPYPNKMKQGYLLMKVKCAKCHTLERTIIAIQTGVAPISGQIFDKSATRAYGIKMLRKPDSNMSKQEVKDVIEVINFLIDESEEE